MNDRVKLLAYRVLDRTKAKAKPDAEVASNAKAKAKPKSELRPTSALEPSPSPT